MRTHALLGPIATLCLSAFAFAALGCSKSDAKGAAESMPSSGAVSACADKVASFNPKASADEKKAYAQGCTAVSAKTQTCIAGAKEDKDVDACLTDPNEKAAFMGAVLGAALPSAASAAASPTATGGVTKLDKLGLELDVPGEAMVSDGMDKTSVMVSSVAVGGLSVGVAGASADKTLKAAKADAKMFKPANLQGEQSANGYWLTFENTGSMGTNYWVKTLQKINGKSYTCEGVPDSADKATAVLAACKSLRAE